MSAEFILMKQFLSCSVALFFLAFVCVTGSSSLARAADSSHMKTLTPEELVHQLAASKSTKPLLLHVGPRMLYLQAHIPGSEYMGAGSTEQGLQNLRQRVSKLPKNTAIVLYCGCCPWNHCPNMNPAYETLEKLGFTNIKALYITGNFGMDWVEKGYPVAKGE